MNRKLAILVLTAAGLLASQVQGQQQPNGPPGAGSMQAPAGESAPQIIVNPELPNEPEGRGEDLRLNGKCTEAIPIFRDLAARGAGFEIARYNLGLCLLDLAKAEPDAQRAASLKHEAAAQIMRAANGGFPGAQLGLVTLYLDGNGVGTDPVEAGKWSLIYHANGTRQVLGLPDVSHDLQARLDGVLTAKTWAEAQSRADAWFPAPQNQSGG